MSDGILAERHGWRISVRAAALILVLHNVHASRWYHTMRRQVSDYLALVEETTGAL